MIPLLLISGLALSVILAFVVAGLVDRQHTRLRALASLHARERLAMNAYRAMAERKVLDGRKRFKA